MTWFKVDDQLASHPKARQAGLAAMGLWAVAGAWSSGYLEDGFVPEWYVASWPQGRKLAEKLVSAGLWYDTDEGWFFHDWKDWQPTREQKLAEREATRKRVEKWRADQRKRESAGGEDASTQGVSNGVTSTVRNGVTNGVRTPAPTRPDPTRPVVTEVTSPVVRRSRATALPEDFTPTEHHRSLAASERVNLDRELAKFGDYYRGTGKAMKDWNATFNNWLRNSRDKSGPPANTPDPNAWMRRRGEPA